MCTCLPCLIKRKSKAAPKYKDGDSSSSEEESEDFNEASLSAHNYYRMKHGVPLLTTNDKLKKYAQEWADKLAKEQKFEHRQDNKYGENLYTFHSTDDTKPKARDAVGSWYSEIKYYKFGKETPSFKTGHFTQVVWKSTREVGMAIAKGSKGWIVVANYNPPGNFSGEYTANVPPRN